VQVGARDAARSEQMPSFAVPRRRRREMKKNDQMIKIDVKEVEARLSSSQPIIKQTLKEFVLEKGTLGALIAVWYGANIWFNLYNKQVLKVPPPLPSTPHQLASVDVSTHAQHHRSRVVQPQRTRGEREVP
jgi:hypothetical protein